MFCSQFAVAVYQAVIVDRLLKENPKFKASKIKMPLAIDMHASYASPLTVHAHLLQAVKKRHGFMRETYSFDPLGTPPRRKHPVR